MLLEKFNSFLGFVVELLSASLKNLEKKVQKINSLSPLFGCALFAIYMW